MEGSTLVAYATRYGSTREVAERIGDRLRERGVAVEVRPARDVRSLDGFSAVVLGAPLYIGSLLKDAGAFLGRHRASLEKVPVAVFALGPMKADELDGSHEQLEGALAKTPWLKPVATEVFIGAYDPARLRGCDRILPAMPGTPLYKAPARDERDWPAIEAWADKLPEVLG